MHSSPTLNIQISNEITGLYPVHVCVLVYTYVLMIIAAWVFKLKLYVVWHVCTVYYFVPT